MTASPPNVLFVCIDSLRRDFCGVYNDEEQTTPHLSELSKEMATYTRAISPSTWTQQVHASLFTGLYPPEHQVLGRNTVLGDHPTFAELFRERGYETRSFGHNGWLETADLLRGFDHTRTRIPGQIRRGLREARDGIATRSTENVLGGLTQAAESVPVKAKKGLFKHSVKGRRTVNNCIANLEEIDDERPFCYFVHINDAHSVFHPAMKYYRDFGDESRLSLLKMIQYQETLKDHRGKIRAGEFEVPEEKLSILRNLYRASIKQVDNLVELLVRSLKETGRYEDTIIIVYGDHGELFGKEGIGHIFSVDDAVIRVPLLIRDPTNELEPGRSDQIVQLNDLYPTVLDLAGIEPPETNSINVSRDSRDAAFVYFQATDSNVESHLAEEGVTADTLPPQKQYVVWKSPEQKLIWDPEKDEFDGPASNDDTLQQQLLDHYRSLKPVPLEGETKVDSDVEENLRQMGYL